MADWHFRQATSWAELQAAHDRRVARRAGLDQIGYVRFRHWRVHGECSLARQPAAVWLYRETLTVAFRFLPTDSAYSPAAVC